MQPETAIESWRDWQCDLPCKPEMIRSMGHGLSNQSYLLNAGGRQMVLRINADNSSLPGIDREREAVILQKASQAGIAPELIHAEQAFFVSQFVEGDSIANALPTEALLAQATGLIRRCHSLEVDAPDLNYAAHIQRYWNLIETNGVQVDESLMQNRQTMRDALHALLASQSGTVLCHHDPVKANFVGSVTRLYLIDWEYAAKGMAIMDYAALAVEWGVTDQRVLKGTNLQIAELNQAMSLYTYMCKLWAIAQSCG